MKPSVRTATDADLEALVAADQIRVLYAKGGLAHLLSVASGILFAAFLWDKVAHSIILGWVAALAVVLIVRLVIRHAYFRRPREPREARPWGIVYAMVTGANGVVWGASALLLWVPDSVAAQMLLMLMLGAMMAGATAACSSYLPTYYAFAIPAVLPLTVRLMSQPDGLHRVLVFLTIIFCTSMTLIVHTGGRALREAAQLRFRNALLVDDLTAARNRLSALNETLESKVVERTAALQSALAKRDEFILLASHELKTPLTSQKLQLQMVERKMGEAGLRARAQLAPSFAVVARQNTRLATLVSTMLDVSSMADGKLELQPHPIDFAQIVRRAVASMEPDLRAHRTQVRLDLEESLVGVWDPVRLEQILTNLLSNAAKYGAGKPIDIALRRDGATACLTVADEGIGIRPHDLERVFGKYERASPARHYGGLGLGLFVVRQLVAAMGGTIEVASNPGAGTRFTLRFPSAWEPAALAH